MFFQGTWKDIHKGIWAVTRENGWVLHEDLSDTEMSKAKKDRNGNVYKTKAVIHVEPGTSMSELFPMGTKVAGFREVSDAVNQNIREIKLHGNGFQGSYYATPKNYQVELFKYQKDGNGKPMKKV